uniref:GTPase Era n=1 Tax=Desulfomonile tiedjei TaxID=2358 RepID=A0A7C4ASY0_9BACT
MMSDREINPPAPIASEESRFGFVAVCGRPNVGKSSLVNRLVGAPLAAVTPKAQTTRHRISGIFTAPGIQIVFHDTPGLHSPRNLLGQAMVAVAKKAVADADVVLVVTDCTQRAPLVDDDTREVILPHSNKSVLVINKIDLVERNLWEELKEKYRNEQLFRAVTPVSAATGEGLQELMDVLRPLIPVGRPMYPEDDISDLPMRFFVGEIIREQILYLTGEELPYVTAVTVEEFRERPNLIYIRADLHVERESQKKILIGRRGEMIKKIGIASRTKLESFLDAKVHLELFVKVSPHWTRDPQKMKEFGYSERV